MVVARAWAVVHTGHRLHTHTHARARVHKSHQMLARLNQPNRNDLHIQTATRPVTSAPHTTLFCLHKQVAKARLCEPLCKCVYLGQGIAAVEEGRRLLPPIRLGQAAALYCPPCALVQIHAGAAAGGRGGRGCARMQRSTINKNGVGGTGGRRGPSAHKILNAIMVPHTWRAQRGGRKGRGTRSDKRTKVTSALRARGCIVVMAEIRANICVSKTRECGLCNARGCTGNQLAPAHHPHLTMSSLR